MVKWVKSCKTGAPIEYGQSGQRGMWESIKYGNLLRVKTYQNISIDKLLLMSNVIDVDQQDYLFIKQMPIFINLIENCRI